MPEIQTDNVRAVVQDHEFTNKMMDGHYHDQIDKLDGALQSVQDEAKGIKHSLTKHATQMSSAKVAKGDDKDDNKAGKSKNTVDPLLSGEVQDGAEAIEQINELMTKLADLFKKLRNLIQDFNVKQEDLAWAVQIAGMVKKREGISDAAEAMYFQAAFTLGAGLLSTGFGAAGAKWDAAATIGQGAGRVAEGFGSIAQADVNTKAELEKLVGGFDDTNAQTFVKKLVELVERARKTSNDMIQLLVELTQLHRSIENALMRS
ncbi:MAG: hypothetical protein ACPGUD_14340 [Parashewanella sp.]